MDRKSEAANVDRVFNFSPGPAVLPLEVLERARDEMWRLQSQLCKFMSPSEYDVPKEYYQPNPNPPQPHATAVWDAVSTEGNEISKTSPYGSPSSFTYVTLKNMLPPSIKESNLTSTLDEHIVDDNYMSRTPEKNSFCPESDQREGERHPDPIEDLLQSDDPVHQKLIIAGEEGLYVCMYLYMYVLSMYVCVFAF